jgi:hypothetical protein
MTKEEKNIYIKDYYKNNPEYAEKCKQRAIEWKKNNPDKVKANRDKSNAKRLTKKQLGIPHGNIGRVQTEEEISKRVKSLTGKERSIEQRNRISQSKNKGRFTREKLLNNTFGFKKGNVPLNKGVPMAKNTKNKLSEKLKGRNSWNKGKELHYKVVGCFIKGQFEGEKNINWKGGVTPTNQLIRHSTEYKQWRKSVFERDDYTCQICFKKEEVSGKLNADHIKPFANFPELRFDINNGRTLCIDCHKETDTYLVKNRWNKKIETV